MIIRADLHVHSSASYDGRSSLSALAEAAKAAGLDAVAVTDHDLCTDVSGDYPVLMIPSVEITTTGGHILGLFLDTPIPPYPENEIPAPEQAIAEIRDHGGLAVLAHPFRPQKLSDAALSALQYDGVEAENARAATAGRDANEKAHLLPAAFYTGGSDAHCAEELDGCCSEIDCTELSLPAIKEAVRSGKITPIFHHACRWKYKGLSQWQKRRDASLPKKLHALCYLSYCIARDVFTRR